jgi:hypothetical protein
MHCSTCNARCSLFVDLGADGRVPFCSVACAGDLALGLTRDLALWLDEERGQDAWSGGPAWTLRKILSFEGCRRLDWLTALDDVGLAIHRLGAWDANQIDNLCSADWERERRSQGLSVEQARALVLGKEA